MAKKKPIRKVRKIAKCAKLNKLIDEEILEKCTQ